MFRAATMDLVRQFIYLLCGNYGSAKSLVFCKAKVLALRRRRRRPQESVNAGAGKQVDKLPNGVL